jgi:hypothetical protein
MSQFVFKLRFFLESTLMEHPCQITVKVQLATDPVQNKLLASEILNELKFTSRWYFSHFYDCLNFNSFNFCLKKIIKDERFHLQHG